LLGRRLRYLIPWIALGACQFPVYEIAPTPADGGGEAGAPAIVDPCAVVPCQHDGRCIPVGAAFVCLCSDGFRGNLCEINFDDCEPDPCQNGSTCIDDTDSSHCACLPGWDGATCEHSVDDCIPGACKNSGTCIDGHQSYSCSCLPGFVGDDCGQPLPPDCRTLLEREPATDDGVYQVDPDGPGVGEPPLEVLCDMHTFDGGWTLVGQEREGDEGTLKFLGVNVGDAGRGARYGDDMLIGLRFRSLYSEMRVDSYNSGNFVDGIRFRTNEEIFANSVRKNISISDLLTTSDTLKGWVSDAGGAIFCRASQDPDVRPGDSSWAIKPQNDMRGGCGCNDGGWQGKGAFYGGHANQTSCSPSGGGWSGVTDEGEQKGKIKRFGVKLWIR
jgi:hypothetical protein